MSTVVIENNEVNELTTTLLFDHHYHSDYHYDVLLVI